MSNVAVANNIEGNITDATPLFGWNAVPGAAVYELWADNRTTPVRKAIWDNQLFVEQMQQRKPLDDHGFQWQVKATGWNDQRGSWTPVQRFTVELSAPNTPVISNPLAGSSTHDTTPTIDWGDVQHATLYDLWIDNRTTGIRQFIRASKLTASEFTPCDPFPPGEYSVEVRAANEQRTTYGGNISNWSTKVIFTITNAAQLSQAVSTFKFGGDFVNRPKIDWNTNRGESTYRTDSPSITRESPTRLVNELTQPLSRDINERFAQMSAERAIQFHVGFHEGVFVVRADWIGESESENHADPQFLSLTLELQSAGIDRLMPDIGALLTDI
ncbi:MAG: hypothetical protein O3A00_18630 [Planctomycetota bacterium]|nr:hypothetical protein [Planctomycetota bacterium]